MWGGIKLAKLSRKDLANLVYLSMVDLLSLVHTPVREVSELSLVRSLVSQNGDNKWGISYSLRPVSSAPRAYSF